MTGSQSFTCGSEGTTMNISVMPVNYAVCVDVSNPVAVLTYPLGNLSIQINKKLNWVQRICYNVLGFKYRKL